MHIYLLHIFYFILSIIAAAYVTGKYTSHHKVITFLIAFWIIGGSITQEEIFAIPIQMMGGKIQLVRVLVIVLILRLGMEWINELGKKKFRFRPPFEKYFFAFAGLLIAVCTYHYFTGIFTFREYFTVLEKNIFVIVLYLNLKKFADDESVNALGSALIVVAVASSVTAIIQFFIKKDFLRPVGEGFPGILEAFGGYWRSSGVYGSEYVHSYTVLAALMLTLLIVRKPIIRNMLVVLFLVGIFLSFHRMSWIVTGFVYILYRLIINPQNIWKITLGACVLVFTLFVLLSDVIPIIPQIEHSEFYKSRLSVDTMTDREKLNEMVLSRFDRICWIGIGSVQNPIYYNSMMEFGFGEVWAKGSEGAIHNLYVWTLFFYGLPVLVLFSLSLISMTRYFRRLYREQNSYFIFPFLIMVMYLLMNMTNSFPLTSGFGFLITMIIGSSTGFAKHATEQSELVKIRK